MKTLDPNLAQHLSCGATTLANCWKLIPVNGPALGFTDHDRPLLIDGVSFEAQAGFEPTEMEAGLGFAPDNLEVAGALSSTQLDAEKLRSGYFDDAGIEVWRVNWADVTQRILLRRGKIGEVSHGGTAFTAELRGLSEQLNVTRGRLFQYACDAVLGDQRCGVNIDNASYKASATVVSVDANRRFVLSGATGFAAGFFQSGTMGWDSGANSGRRDEIKLHTLVAGQTVIELWRSAAFTVAVGDTLVLRAGCDKQFTTCRQKFANGDNFRGFPHIPGTDFVTSFVSRNDPKKDGSSRN